jgi:glyoxylase-like metal-dependent hydrolase (beta-lactamase superfamily II)
VKHITLIKGGFSNCYLIKEEDTLILVDVGSSNEVKEIMKRLSDSSDNKRRQPIVIISTHFHIDHIAGISYLLCNFPDAEVAFYKKVKDFLTRKEKLSISSIMAWFGNLPPVYIRQERHIPSLIEIKKDDRVGIPLPLLRRKVSLKYEVNHWLEDGDTIPHAGDWRVISTPGHTPDSACLWCEKDNALISGDTIINMAGKGELNLFCCDYLKEKESFSKLKSFFNVKNLYPGHGNPIEYKDDLLSEVKIRK